jgi:hypothetical protein
MDEAPIKAVELVRSIRDEMYEEIKGLSPDQLKAFITREAQKAGGTYPSAVPSADRPAA